MKTTLVQRQYYASSPERVWQAWTDAKHVAHWWGPFGPEHTTASIDLREGGHFQVSMLDQQGQQHQARGIIESLKHKQKLVIQGLAPSSQIDSALACDPCGAGLPPDAKVTIEFALQDQGTELILTTEFNDDFALQAANNSGFSRSWQASIIFLDEYLKLLESPNFVNEPKLKTPTQHSETTRINAMSEQRDSTETSLYLRKTLNASLDQVWKAWSQDDLLEQWLCPKPWRAKLTDFEFKSGGAFDTVMHGPDGEAMPCQGSFLHIEEKKRIVFTTTTVKGWQPIHSDMPMHAEIEFDTEDGNCVYIATVRHDTSATKQEHEKLGFFEGWSAALVQLEELAQSL